MMNFTAQNVLLTAVFLLVTPSERHSMVATAAMHTNDHDTSTAHTHSTTSSLRRLRQKMVYIPDLFDITPMQDEKLTTSSSSEWYDSNRGVVTHNEKLPKQLPSLFNKYRSHNPLSTIHTTAQKYSKENLSLEMEIFERLLQDESSMSLSMPTQPTAPTPIIVTPPTAPSPVTAPIILSPPTVPSPISIPSSPAVPTPVVDAPTPGVITPSSVPPPQGISPVTAPSTKGKDPNGMMSSSKSSAPSTSKGVAPSTPTSKVPSSKGGVESPSSKGGPTSKGQPSSPTSKSMVSAPSTTPSSKGGPTSKGQPSSPTSKSMVSAPSSPETQEPTPLLGSKGGPATSSPFGAMSGTPPTSGSTTTAPATTPLAPGPTPTAASPTIFEGEGTIAPGGSEATSREAMILSKCGVSENDRSQAILGDVSTVSPLSELVDETSVAHTALVWLDKEDDFIVCSDGTGAVMQRYVLAMFYFSMNGFEWTNCRAAASEVAGPCIDGKPWLDLSHECEWYGVECDTNSTVTKLTLKSNNLVGVLPDELFFLTGLVGLSLDHNMYIGGEIPEAIGKLTKLTYIELDENFLGGSIPQSLYSLTTLQAIDLNGNKLMGTISESIMNLPSLAVLQIEDNLFEGSLPTGLASLEELLVLYVHGNNFTGTSLQHVCALMDSRRQTNVAYLQFLTADCKDTTKVECTCCDCF